MIPDEKIKKAVQKIKRRYTQHFKYDDIHVDNKKILATLAFLLETKRQTLSAKSITFLENEIKECQAGLEIEHIMFH